MPWPHKDPPTRDHTTMYMYWYAMPVRVVKGPFKGWEGQAVSPYRGTVYITFPNGREITFQAAQLHRIEPEELA